MDKISDPTKSKLREWFLSSTCKPRIRPKENHLCLVANRLHKVGGAGLRFVSGLRCTQRNNFDGVSLPFFWPWRATARPLDRVPCPGPWLRAVVLSRSAPPGKHPRFLLTPPSLSAASPSNLIRATRFLTSSKWRIFRYSYPQLLSHMFVYPTIYIGKRSPLSLLQTNCLQDQNGTLSWERPASSPAITAAWHTLV